MAKHNYHKEQFELFVSKRKTLQAQIVEAERVQKEYVSSASATSRFHVKQTQLTHASSWMAYLRYALMAAKLIEAEITKAEQLKTTTVAKFHQQHQEVAMLSTFYNTT